MALATSNSVTYSDLCFRSQHSFWLHNPFIFVFFLVYCLHDRIFVLTVFMGKRLFDLQLAWLTCKINIAIGV